MDYYDPRDDLDEPPLKLTSLTPIQQLFEGANILITGASGFMGRLLMEKLLRTCNVAQIFVLVRDKKGVKSGERLSSILNDKLFEPLKLQKPGEVYKLKIVTGDCNMPGLGLSERYKAMLSSVNMIFHAAAVLRMNEHLKTAFTTNVLATKCLLDYARTLPNLKAFIHISTAYSHAHRSLVEETLYDTIDDEVLGQICKEMNDHQIGSLTPKLVGRWNNTYAFTKACTENLVSKYDGILPIGIVRPSIVVATWREPLAGWINNVYGAAGVVTGAGLGLLRVWCADPYMAGDMIPADVVINATLATTWEVAVANTRMKIYNVVSSPSNPITYDILRTANLTHGAQERLDSTHCIASAAFYLTKNKTVFTIYTLWYHVLPAFFIDMYLKLIGKTPMLMKAYIKVYNANKCLMAYCVDHDIEFISENVTRLWEKMDPMDKKLFTFDIKLMNWDSFWLYSLRGMRVYFLNDPMDSIPEGITHCRKLFLRKMFFDSIVWSVLGSIGYLISKKMFFAYF